MGAEAAMKVSPLRRRWSSTWGGPAASVQGAEEWAVCLAADQTSVMLKALREEQEALVARNPEVCWPSWAFGQFAWLEVDLAAADDEELRELLTEAWRLSAPKFLIARHVG